MVKLTRIEDRQISFQFLHSRFIITDHEGFDKTVLVISRIQKILSNTKEHRFIVITTYNGWVHERVCLA